MRLSDAERARTSDGALTVELPVATREATTTQTKKPRNPASRLRLMPASC